MTILNSTVVEFDIEKQSFREFSIDDLQEGLRDKNKIFWIHCNLSQQDVFKDVRRILTLPDDVIKMCQEEDGIPKLIDTDDALTIQVQCLRSTELDINEEIYFSNLIIHLTNHFCFTAASEEAPVLIELKNSFPKAIRYAKTPCFILFLILDNIVNDFAHVLFNFELISERMDLNVRGTHNNLYNEVMEAKQQVMKIKHYNIGVREILMRISGRHISVISEQCRSSLYNLSNHTHMVVHEADSIRDILNGLLGQIDNMLMQKMSETMRILTAFAAIFLPLTLITGIYGMNFQWMPELHWKYGYFIILGVIFLCGIGLLFIFRKMKWF